MAPRILVVQSRPDAARALSAALAAAAMEAVVLLDGHGVVSAIATFAPHIVLVDLTLPALDGWYVLAQLGASASKPFVVVRVGTAADAGRALALGADSWVDDDAHLVAAAGKLVPTIAA